MALGARMLSAQPVARDLLKSSDKPEEFRFPASMKVLEKNGRGKSADADRYHDRST